MRSNNIFIIHHPKICWNDLWNILKWFLFLQPFIKEGEANFTWIRSIIVTKYYEPFLHEVQPKHGFTPPGNDILSPRSRKKFQVKLLQREQWPAIKSCGFVLKSTSSHPRQTKSKWSKFKKGSQTIFCWVFHWKTAWQEAWDRTHANTRAPWPCWHGEHWEEDHQEDFCTSCWII